MFSISKLADLLNAHSSVEVVADGDCILHCVGLPSIRIIKEDDGRYNIQQANPPLFEHWQLYALTADPKQIVDMIIRLRAEAQKEAFLKILESE